MEYLYKYNDVCLDLYFRVQHFGNYTEWIQFFLQCIINSANQTIKRFNVAVDERAKMEKKLQHSGKFSGKLTAICDSLEKMPIFMINDLVNAFHVSYNTASNRVDMLVKINIIKKEKEQQRNRFFTAQNYIDIFIESE